MLSELKVIDASTVLAGPSVGTFFAELGAHVIKVENPSVPDVTRSWKLPVENPASNVSAYFSSINYKKEYRSIDLQSDEGRKEFYSLISDADILISNFKMGDEEKFGITDTILRQLNPGLICGKISGFGSNSDRVAYDLILQAESGFMSMNGTPDSGPVKMPVALIDVLAAHHLKEGLLIALLKRISEKKGSTVTVSLYDAAVCSLVNQASNYLMTGKVPSRIGSLHPNIAPYGEIFRAKDGESITFAVGSDEHFRRLCVFLGCVELINDAKYANNHLRVINRYELYDLLQQKISELPSELILSEMLKQKVPVGKIRPLDEVFSNPKAQELIREETIEGSKTRRVTSIAFKWE